MFCTKCGNQLPDSVAFCPFCGNKLAGIPAAPVAPVAVAPVAPVAAPVVEAPVAPVAPVAAPVVEAPAAPVAPVAAPVVEAPAAPVAPVAAPVVEAPVATQPAPKKKHTLLIVIIAVVAALAVAAGALYFTGVFDNLFGSSQSEKESEGGKGGSKGENTSADDVATDFAKLIMVSDIKAQSKLCIFDYEQYVQDDFLTDYEDEDEFFEEAGDELGEDISSWKEFYAAYLANSKDYLANRYGDDYTIKAKITGTEELDEDEIADVIDDLLEDFGDYMDKDKAEDVREGKLYTVKLTIDGEEDKSVYTAEIVVVKYDGAWKVADYSYRAATDSNAESTTPSKDQDNKVTTRVPNVTAPPIEDSYEEPSYTEPSYDEEDHTEPSYTYPEDSNNNASSNDRPGNNGSSAMNIYGTITNNSYINLWADLYFSFDDNWVNETYNFANTGDDQVVDLYLSNSVDGVVVEVIFVPATMSTRQYIIDLRDEVETQLSYYGYSVEHSDLYESASVADHDGIGNVSIATGNGEQAYMAMFVYQMDDYLVVINVNAMSEDAMNETMESITSCYSF